MTGFVRTALLALIASLVMLAGCQKEEAPSGERQRAPVAMPTSQDDGEWRQYVGQMISRNVPVRRGIPPFAVYVSPDGEEEDRQSVVNNALQTLQRGVQRDTIIAFGSRDSALMAEKMVEMFEKIPENRLTGARVVFVGRAEHREQVEEAVAGSGAQFIFLEFGS